jgi:hypothetical protein
VNYDLAKTQFLVTKGGFTTSITAYRRKRVNMMFDREGKPMRTISGADWFAFLCKYEKEAKADGITCKVVWLLVPVE